MSLRVLRNATTAEALANSSAGGGSADTNTLSVAPSTESSEDVPPSHPTRAALPGFVKDFDYVPSNAFPHVLLGDYRSRLPLTTLREFAMLRMMDHITDKPDWDTKVLDETISSEWKSEASNMEDCDISNPMVNWVIEELRYKARLYKEVGLISVLPGEVVKSDSAVSSSLRDALIAAVRSFEERSQDRDYHPGSNEKVVDIVHPSLFPLLYGRSRIIKGSVIGLNNCMASVGTGDVLPEIQPPAGSSFSTKFQWLPCEVAFADFNLTGENKIEVKITSYINNVHPERHPNLYSAIEQIISKAIPLWNKTLATIEENPWTQKLRINLEVIYERSNGVNSGDDEDDLEQGSDEDDDDYYLRSSNRHERKVIQPEPKSFVQPRPSSFDLKERFAKSGLQVIVKLANIELDPEKPNYEGGSWHIEGALNEHICATALYYYDSENITESRLAFRHSVDTDIEIYYEQDEHGWLEQIYGCENEGPGVQESGSVVCKEGRLVTFPNILQHKVLPFKLEDKEKPGHRKILALFLVDPHLKVISTANVPPQQKEWWKEEVIKTDTMKSLSRELADQVLDGVDFPIELKEAKNLRLELMDERSIFSDLATSRFEGEVFSLCEH